MPDNTTHQVNLLDFLAFLIRWRKFLAACVLSASIAIGIVSFIVKPKYRSTAVIQATERSNEGFGGIIAAKLAKMSGISGLAPGFSETPAKAFVLILKSRWMNEQVINALDLRRVYQLPTQPIEDVIEVLKAHTRYELDPLSDAVVVYSEDHDPKLAQSMTAFLVDNLDKRNQELHATDAKREREFIGRRLDEARAYLTSIEDSLSRFQFATGVLNVEEQVKATVGAAAQLEAQRLALRTQIEMDQQIFEPTNPEIGYLRLKLAGLDSTIQALSRKRAKGAQNDFMLHLEDTPTEGMTYLRLMRDIEIQQLLVGFLIQQYEQARIEEQRNTPTIMRLDPPVVATVRIWPKRGLMIAVAAFGAFVLGIIYALLRESLHRAAVEPTDPNYQRILAIKRSWSGGKD
jgi:tyrosine-protein kinase Etk/Wzc